MTFYKRFSEDLWGSGLAYMLSTKINEVKQWPMHVGCTVHCLINYHIIINFIKY